MSDDPDSTTTPASTATAPVCVNAVPASNGATPTVTVNTSALRTRHDWHWIALCNAFGSDIAGEIDGGSAWIVSSSPSVTFSSNKDIIRNVYEYYGALNKRDPRKCIWAGLARVAGGPFFGGFVQIDQMERDAQGYIDRCETPPDSFWQSIGREDYCGSGSLMLVEAQILDECDASIRALMSMGKDIFVDLAWQHEAYLGGGLAEIQRLDAAGEFGANGQFSDAKECVALWGKIDGDDEGAWSGNLGLFQREQLVTIPGGYRKLRSQFAVATVMTYLAKSPHPWGRSFDDYFAQTPLGSHSVANDNDRWDWMKNEVYATWRKAGDQRSTLVARPLDDLIAGKLSVP